MSGPLTVDIHAHFFPLGVPDLAPTTGDGRWPSMQVDDGGPDGTAGGRIMCGTSVFRRVSRACFDAGARLAELEAAGVDHQVISPVPITLVDWAPPAEAARLLRSLTLASTHPLLCPRPRPPAQIVELFLHGAAHCARCTCSDHPPTASPSPKEL